MSNQSDAFQRYYSAMSEGELLQLARIRKSLDPAAEAALAAELSKRGLEQSAFWPPRSALAQPRGNAASLRTIDISRITRPLRLVSLANYFLILLGVQGPLSAIAGIITGPRSLSSLTALLINAMAMAYCAWVGWKNIGVRGAAGSRHNFSALMVMAALFLLVVAHSLLKLSRGVPDSAGQEVAFLNLIIGTVVVLACFAGFAALTHVRRLSIPYLGIKLKTFLNEGFLRQANPDAKLPAMAPWKGSAYLVGGILWLGAFALIPERFFVQNSSWSWRLGPMGYLLLIHAKQFFQPDFETVIANDNRPPVLFLRSFVDDEKINDKNMDTMLFGLSLESRLADHFFRVGPFIAVGAPKDKTPHLGAVRVKLTDTEWQAVVIRWMNESALILSMAGISEWAAWELNRIVDLGHVNKLMVVFPYVKRTWWKVWERWEHQPGAEVRLILVQGAFARTIWEPGLSHLSEPHNIRSIVFEPGGGVTAVISRPRNVDSYQLAALVGHYLMLCRETGDAKSNPGLSEEADPTVAGFAVAGFARRALAAGLDTLLVAAVAVISAWLIPPVGRAATWLAQALGLLASVPITAATLTLGFCYYTVCEGLSGTTIGKLVCGVRVRKISGEPCGFRSSFLRNLIRFADGVGGYAVGLIVAAPSHLSQRLGDRVAATVVVGDSRSVLVRCLAAAVLVLALLGGLQCVTGSRISIASLPSMPLAPLGAGTVIKQSGQLYAGFRFVVSKNGPSHSPDYKRGESLLVELEVIGYGRDSAGAADVRTTFSVTDPSGLLVFEPAAAPFHQTIPATSRIAVWFGKDLPPFAPAGHYYADVKIHDQSQNADFDFKQTFLVDGLKVTWYGPGIRDLGLSLSPDGPVADDPVATAGTKIYVGGNVVGLGERGRHLDGHIGQRIIAPDGSTVANNPDLVSFRDYVFYHPATFMTPFQTWLSIPGGYPRGTYLVEISLSDSVSGRKTMTKRSFRLD